MKEVLKELGKDKLMQNQEQTSKLNKRTKNLFALYQKQAEVYSSWKGISTIAVLILLNLNGSCGILLIFRFKGSPHSCFFQRQTLTSEKERKSEGKNNGKTEFKYEMEGSPRLCI